jgi:hypothetical protein
MLAAAEPERSIYENGRAFEARGRLDEILLRSWRRNGIQPAKTASDAVFLRRVYIDLIGTAPGMDEARSFLADESPDKRDKLIEQLLKRKEFALYWSLKWCDVLRVKSEFPINLWPNAVQAYHHRVWQAVEDNMPYDRFARELLTASGSNFREPAVNFYRATQDRSPAGWARVAARTFLCSKVDDWPKSARGEFEKFFSRVALKATDEWKEQIVYLDPKPAKGISVAPPVGDELTIPPDRDPRRAFADWLIDGPGGKWFAQAAVNRTWFWLFGRGIVHDPDSFVLGNKTARATVPWWGNAPVNPELLEYLAEEFKRSGYDFKALCRLITTSAAYRQSCIPAGDLASAEKHFGVYPIRRVDAEVLIDTLNRLAQTGPEYVSVIPEPFTFVPPEHPTIALADGSITSSFLETFGRPARDTGYLMERSNAVTYSQRLFLLNSPLVQWRVPRSKLIRKAVWQGRKKPKDVIDNLYLLILSRYPSDGEYEMLKEHFKSFEGKQGGREQAKARREAGRSLLWALMNTREFLFRH